MYSRSQNDMGTRKDLNCSEWVPAFAIPKPGVPYLATNSWEFKTETQPAAQDKRRDVFRGR